MSTPLYPLMDAPQELPPVNQNFDTAPKATEEFWDQGAREENLQIISETVNDEPMGAIDVNGGNVKEISDVKETTNGGKEGDIDMNQGNDADVDVGVAVVTDDVRDAMPINCIFADDNGEATESRPVEKDADSPPPVAPGSTGFGAPYAPSNWPEAGDDWGWRVGKRYNVNGYFQDRFLTIPKRLQKPKGPKVFASKPTLERYIQNNYPNADVDAFFASFSWKVAAITDSSVDNNGGTHVTNGEDEKENVQTVGDDSAPRYSQRKRQAKATPEPVAKKAKGNTRSSQRKKQETPNNASVTPKQQARGRRPSKQTGGTVDLNDANTADIEEEQEPIPHIYVSPINGVITLHSPVDIVPEEFDNYLTSLDFLLMPPPSEEKPADSEIVGSPYKVDEVAEARSKLSSLLAKDFPSLFFHDDITELAKLASKVRKDPTLSAEQLVRLKLVEEIPSFTQLFLENNGIIQEADKFFTSLEDNITKVGSLKSEYTELKEKVVQVQVDEDNSVAAIKRIDEQIVQLQAQRAEFNRTIKIKEKEISELNYGQKMIANQIPKVVEEVQAGNSKKGEWEVKKENALKREAEIIAKFSPLKGFYL